MLKKIISIALLLPVLSACSAAMALHGKPTPNLNVLAVGSDKSDVEKHLGSPAVTNTLSNGQVKNSYQYTVGSDSSPARAAGYVALDLFTFFFAEIITTPLELSLGEKRIADVTYDKNDKVIDMDLRKGKIPNAK